MVTFTTNIASKVHCKCIFPLQTITGNSVFLLFHKMAVTASSNYQDVFSPISPELHRLCASPLHTKKPF